MKRVLLVVAWLSGSLLLLLICAALLARDRVLQFAHTWRERTDGAALADKLNTPHDVLDYIAQHPEQASLASWELGREADGLFLNADRKQPLASAIELRVLAAYAQQVVGDAHFAHERVLIADWERYWLPAVDGGVHLAALNEARALGRVEQANPRSDLGVASAEAGSAAQPAVHLRDVVRAMIRYGDRSASDFLIERLGRGAFDHQAERLGLGAEETITPFSGLRLSWAGGNHAAPASELLARYRALGLGQYAELTWDLTRRLGEDGSFREREREHLDEHWGALSLTEQVQLTAAFSARGTARGYAQLMQRIAAGELPGSEQMRAQLEWPLENATTRSEFDVLGTKNGALPGVLASARYARAKNATGTKVLAVFLQQLPAAVWLHMSQSYVQQRFELELLQNEAFFALAKQRLNPNDMSGLEDEAKLRHANAQ